MKTLVLSILVVFLLSLGVQADVKHETEGQYKFSGALGTVMKIFGMGKPIHTVEYYMGDFKRTDKLDKKGKVRTSDIIDLANERFVSIDHKKKKYETHSFSEWKDRMQQAFGGAEVEEPEDQEYESEYEYSFKLDMQLADQPEDIHGRLAKKLTVTADVFAKKKGSEEDPVKQMSITSHNWLSTEIDGNDEIMAFNQKLVTKLGIDPKAKEMASMFKKISESNPELAEAMRKLEAEGKELEGVPVKTITTFTSYPQPEEEQEEEEESSGGGMLGGLKKKAASSVFGGKKKAGPKKVLDINHVVMDHSTAGLSADMFGIPDKYKEKK